MVLCIIVNADEDSTLTLAETGEYQGPDEIKEYVKFVDVETVFFDIAKRMDKLVPTPVRLTEDECSILFTTTNKYQTNAQDDNGQCIETVVGYTLHYSTSSFKMNRISLFYSRDFLSELFGKALDSDYVGGYICGVMENNCQETFKLNNLTSGSCRSMYDSLPLTNAKGYLDDKSKGCMILHSVSAAQNEDHCPHLSFIPQEDNKGRIKCQQSKETKPSDIFSTFELDTIKKQGRGWGFDESLCKCNSNLFS